MNFPEQPPKLAVSRINGGPLAPDIKGEAMFEEVPDGVMVTIYVEGLPNYQPATNGKKPIGPHGFHIHENGVCEIGNPNDPFQSAGGHWNPNNEPHGNHPGDFPVLFSNNGIAYMIFFTNRFEIDDIVGKAIIIHESPDDYESQPSGAAGKRLACGLIQPYEYEVRMY
jgi:superoxide dismutase, Cu-Zn family